LQSKVSSPRFFLFLFEKHRDTLFKTTLGLRASEFRFLRL